MIETLGQAFLIVIVAGLFSMAVSRVCWMWNDK